MFPKPHAYSVPCDTLCSTKEFITEGTSAVHSSTDLKQESFAMSSIKSNTETQEIPQKMHFLQHNGLPKFRAENLPQRRRQSQKRFTVLPCAAKLTLLYVARCKVLSQACKWREQCI